MVNVRETTTLPGKNMFKLKATHWSPVNTCRTRCTEMPKFLLHRTANKSQDHKTNFHFVGHNLFIYISRPIGTS